MYFVFSQSDNEFMDLFLQNSSENCSKTGH